MCNEGAAEWHTKLSLKLELSEASNQDQDQTKDSGLIDHLGHAFHKVA